MIHGTTVKTVRIEFKTMRRVLKQKWMWAVRRFLSCCESLWYVHTRAVKCATVIHCRIIHIHITDDQLIVNIWRSFRCEAAGGKTISICIRSAVRVMVSQHKLRSCVWNLFIPADIITLILFNVTVHRHRSAFFFCQYWRFLCDHIHTSDSCRIIMNQINFINLDIPERRTSLEWNV